MKWTLLRPYIQCSSLSRTHLWLIASMFSQMCEAVARCHNADVSHRDIGPENAIVPPMAGLHLLVADKNAKLSLNLPILAYQHTISNQLVWTVVVTLI